MTAPPGITTHIGRPRYAESGAAALARDGWGVSGTWARLPSERDQNFQVTTESGQRFVLKISETTEDVGVLECQNAVLARLKGGRSSAPKAPMVTPISCDCSATSPACRWRPCVRSRRDSSAKWGHSWGA